MDFYLSMYYFGKSRETNERNKTNQFRFKKTQNFINDKRKRSGILPDFACLCDLYSTVDCDNAADLALLK